MAKKSKALRMVLKDHLLLPPLVFVASFIDGACPSPAREEAKESVRHFRRSVGFLRASIRKTAKELGVRVPSSLR